MYHWMKCLLHSFVIIYISWFWKIIIIFFKFAVAASRVILDIEKTENIIQREVLVRFKLIPFNPIVIWLLLKKISYFHDQCQYCRVSSECRHSRFFCWLMFWNGNGMCTLILNVNIINQFLLTFIILLGWHSIAACFVIILANPKACNSQLF